MSSQGRERTTARIRTEFCGRSRDGRRISGQESGSAAFAVECGAVDTVGVEALRGPRIESPDRNDTSAGLSTQGWFLIGAPGEYRDNYKSMQVGFSPRNQLIRRRIRDLAACG